MFTLSKFWGMVIAPFILPSSLQAEVEAKDEDPIVFDPTDATLRNVYD
jgi:hypothetical protein